MTVSVTTKLCIEDGSHYRASISNGERGDGNFFGIYQIKDSGWTVTLNGSRVASFACLDDAESFTSGMKKGMMGQ